MIKILFFAHLRDLAEVNQITLEREQMTHVRDLLNNFADKLPAELVEALRDESAMVSINQKYAGWGAELPDFCEVGILPPVSGG